MWRFAFLMVAIFLVATGGLAAGLLLTLRGSSSTIAQQPGCVILKGGKEYCPEREKLNPPSTYTPIPVIPAPVGSTPGATAVPRPTPAPIPLPYRLNPAAVLPAPPVHRVGPAHQLGRTDCPAGWNALISDSTGMSVCFPRDAQYLNGAKDRFWHWEDGWDEGVIIVVPQGSVTVHRIGNASIMFAPQVNKEQLTDDIVNGLPAKTWVRANPDGRPIDPTESRTQEAFGYIISRGNVDWEVSIHVGINQPDIAASKAFLRQIVATVQIP